MEPKTTQPDTLTAAQCKAAIEAIDRATASSGRNLSASELRGWLVTLLGTLEPDATAERKDEP